MDNHDYLVNNEDSKNAVNEDHEVHCTQMCSYQQAESTENCSYHQTGAPWGHGYDIKIARKI